MQLRLGSPNRATEHSRNLFMFMSFDIMKNENCAIAGRQLRDGFIERDTINNRHCVRVLCAFDDLHGRLAVFRGLFHTHAAFAKVHQNLIDGETVQPRRKGRLAAKASYFSKELDEDLLRQVFGLRDALRHSQAEGINATVMTLVKLLEGLHIAFGSPLRQRVIRSLRFLGFGCGHLSVTLGRAEGFCGFFILAASRTDTRRAR